MTRRNHGSLLLALALASMLGACMSGTGTDTENGIQVTARVVDPNGAPMANVDVEVHSPDADPDQSPASPLMPGTGSLRTDSAGFVHFTVKRAGQYMAQGRRGDTVLVLDTLNAFDSTEVVFQTSAVRRLQGKVRLYSGYGIDTGRVFLRGSSLRATIGHNGEYDFGYVPVTAARLTLGTRYEARPVSKVFVRMAEAGTDLVIDSRFSIDSNLVPSGGANLTLLKASQSATNVCLDNGKQPLVPGVSLKGSVDNRADVMRAASFACSNKVGAEVQVDKSDLRGKPLKKLGAYVLPDASIWPGNYKALHGLASYSAQRIVVPSACLTSGATTRYTTGVVDGTSGAEIRVDDISLESGCEF